MPSIADTALPSRLLPTGPIMPSKDAVRPRRFNVLLLDDDRDDAHLFAVRSMGRKFKLQWCDSISAAIEQLGASTIDVIVLDLGLREGQGIDSFRRIKAAARDIPIVVFSGNENVELATAAVREGAQDYLVKGTFEAPLLERSLRYAIERKRLILHDLRREKEAVTERERLAAIVNSTDDAVVSVDTNGILMSWNPGAERMFGYSADEAIGQHAAMLWPRNARVSGEETINRAVSGESFGAVEAQRVHKCGRMIDVLISISPIKDSQGRVVSVAGIIHDMTERKRAEQAEHSLRAVESQLEVAREIHRRLLPGHDPRLSGFDIAGICLPASAVGGDYFDYIMLPDGRLVTLVADVSSHGFAPALIMTGTRRLLRSLFAATTDMKTIVRLANQAIEEDTEHHNFVTLFLAILDAKSRTLEYIGCGHSAHLIRRGKGIEELRSLAFPLGIVGDFEAPDPIICTLEPEDILLLFTDGFNESESKDQEPFGMARLVSLVERNSAGSAREILDSLVSGVEDFCRPNLPIDDRTAVIVKVD